jgi:hypothetical protein
MGIWINSDFDPFLFGIFTPLENPVMHGGEVEKNVYSFLRADLKTRPF